MRNKLLFSLATTATILSTVAGVSASTYPMSQKEIFLNGSLVSAPDGIAANDPSSKEPTTYVPIWYAMQALNSLGITSDWDGTNWHLKLPSNLSPAVDLSTVTPGNGPLKMYVNGTLVQTVKGITANDPASGQPTTFMPIWYVTKVLNYVDVQSTWDGKNWRMTEATNTGNTTGVTKLSVLKQFMDTLNIQPSASGTNPYSDISTGDWGYVNAAIQKGLITPDSSANFGANDSITINTVDTMYWNYIGIPSADAKYQPGGAPYQWGQDIELNRGIVGEPMSSFDVTQMATNLKDLQQGYYQDSNGVYHVVYPAADEWVHTFKYAVLPSFYQADIVKAYSVMNQITFTISGSTVIVKMPTFASTDSFELGVGSDKGTTYYSFNGGKTWSSGKDGGYDTQDPNNGGMSTLPNNTVLLKAPTRIGIELDDYGKNVNLLLPRLAITATQNGPLVQRYNLN